MDKKKSSKKEAKLKTAEKSLLREMKCHSPESRPQKAMSIKTVGIIFFNLDGTIQDAYIAFLNLFGLCERAKICSGMLEIESRKGKCKTVFTRVPLKI